MPDDVDRIQFGRLARTSSTSAQHRSHDADEFCLRLVDCGPTWPLLDDIVPHLGSFAPECSRSRPVSTRIRATSACHPPASCDCDPSLHDLCKLRLACREFACPLNLDCKEAYLIGGVGGVCPLWIFPIRKSCSEFVSWVTCMRSCARYVGGGICAGHGSCCCGIVLLSRRVSQLDPPVSRRRPYWRPGFCPGGVAAMSRLVTTFVLDLCRGGVRLPFGRCSVPPAWRGGAERAMPLLGTLGSGINCVFVVWGERGQQRSNADGV